MKACRGSFANGISKWKGLNAMCFRRGCYSLSLVMIESNIIKDKSINQQTDRSVGVEGMK